MRRAIHSTRHLALRAEVDVNLRQQSRHVGGVTAIAKPRIDGVEGDCAYQCSSKTLQLSHLLLRKLYSSAREVQLLGS